MAKNAMQEALSIVNVELKSIQELMLVVVVTIHYLRQWTES